MRLQFEYGVELKERKSVIIFDEVQLAPKVRQAIKYLVKDGIYDNVPLIWNLPCAHVGRGMRRMRSANIISLYFIASQCVMDRYCSCSASWGRVHEHALFIMHWYSLEYRNVVFVLRDWVPGKYMFVHKNGPFRGCKPGNCNAVHVFPAYCGWGRSGMDGPGVYVSEGKAPCFPCILWMGQVGNGWPRSVCEWGQSMKGGIIVRKKHFYKGVGLVLPKFCVFLKFG